MLQVQHEADIEIKINKCKSVKIEKSNLIVAGLDGLLVLLIKDIQVNSQPHLCQFKDRCRCNTSLVQNWKSKYVKM